MALEPKYQWLLQEEGPIMIHVGLELYGTAEMPGMANNPEIMSWATELGVTAHYKNDETPWCGLFMAIVAKRSSYTVVSGPLLALNWSKFGNEADFPKLGDVLVFLRKTKDGKTSGHVGIYVGEDSLCYHVLGGNQSDKVSITRIEKDRLQACRRPHFETPPANLRKIILSNTGEISKNEQ